MQVDQGSEFYNKSFKKWFEDNDIEMYSTKYVAAERFIRTLKHNIYKHMIAVQENNYFDVLDNIVNKYDITYYNSIKMKTTDVKPVSYAEYNVDSNTKDPKCEIEDHEKISMYKSLFPKGFALIGQKKFSQSAKLKILYHGNMLLVILMVKELLEHFMKKNFIRLIKKNLE